MEIILTLLSIIAVIIPAYMAYLSKKNFDKTKDILVHFEEIKAENKNKHESNKESLKYR
ncbi:UNVERIFIED_ORG: uncharacterized protein YacL [Buttiauxella agrestis ATCC 33320]